ncbi:unnamed protein product [Anisakis simplex]|uniref:Putative malate dehydrogenase (inferred by orthology to a S. mansoni protein) n=1 Tax=Anisakis simplex TaxID=6269 RepID=A0A0M3J9D6_ANISI|nr:unnamed protein product [Anisakis simplex]
MNIHHKIRFIQFGQCFVAIDPTCFAPGFHGRLQELINEMRDLKQLNDEQPVLIAGDPERAHMSMCDEVGGIVYKKTQLLHIVSILYCF